MGTSTTINYEYDLDGLRLKKNVNGVVHNYVYASGKLLRESYTQNSTSYVLDFVYDRNGRPFMLYLTEGNNAPKIFYYLLNYQGDVVRIVTAAGVTAAEYRYDAWGKATEAYTTSGSTVQNLAAINPLRYRGYYYDAETGWYYVSSRYYDPGIGRFINSDDADLLGANGDFTSLNLFAYCGNNPVSRRDEGGAAWETVFDVISLASSIIDVAANPDDLWAWAGLIGDVIDVAVPFVAGAGELIRAFKTTDKIVDAVDVVDDIHDTSKTVGNVTEAMGAACFIAGTLVFTDNGYEAIENIKVNDYVWAWDEKTEDISLKRVVETYVNEASTLIHVFVSDEEIITTPTHPFYSPIKGWTAASTLRSGDILVLINGEEVIIEDVQHEILESPISVYNFAVEDFHTYYIGCSKILVHNMCQRALTVDEFISNFEDTTRKKGATTRNLISSGGYDQALNDFYAFSPLNVKPTQTDFGPGLAGKLPTGERISIRPGSNYGGATMDLRVSSRRNYKIRYGY